MSLGEIINRARKEAKLTLVQLGNDTGLTQGYLSNVEGNKRKPSPEALEKIAKVLGLNHLWLMEAAGYTKEIDRMEVLQSQLLSLQESKMHKSILLDAVARELSRSDLDEERRNHLSKTFEVSSREIQRIDLSIEETENYIESFEKASQVQDMIESFTGEAKSKVELENIFNIAQEITINGKTLTEEEKQKALQILKLAFDN